MEIGGVTLRDAILVISGLVGVYLVIMVLRLVQIGRHKTVVFDTAASEPPPPVDSAEEEAAEETFVYPRPQIEEAAPPPSFGAELSRSHLEREVKQLREEVATLRA